VRAIVEYQAPRPTQLHEQRIRRDGSSLAGAVGVLGGGSSINVLAWVRGHREDWEHFAAEAGDEAWNYQSVLGLYRRIEDWQGAPDAAYRGTGGPVSVQPAQQPSPVIPALLAAAVASGIPQVPST
jgi:choline dehydrogenase